MPNTNYAIAAGGYTGQPAYTAFATEIVLSREWENVYLRAMPLLAKIKDGKANWNKPGLRKGNLLLLPVLLSANTTLPDGVTDAGELTGISPYATAGFTQAQYNIAHYRGAMYVRESEKQLINNTRGNFMQGKIEQLMADFKNAVADDLASTSADSRTAVLGIQQVLATANTVGNIDQSSDTDWQSNVTTSAGAFSLDMLDDKIDAVAVRNGKIDMMLFAYSSTNNLFGKLRAALSPAERLVNANFKAKYGFTNIEYLDAVCVADNRLTAGVICGFDSSTWFYAGDEKPVGKEVQRYPGTDMDEYMYTLWAGVGCNNPAKNFRLTGVS